MVMIERGLTFTPLGRLPMKVETLTASTGNRSLKQSNARCGSPHVSAQKIHSGRRSGRGPVLLLTLSKGTSAHDDTSVVSPAFHTKNL